MESQNSGVGKIDDIEDIVDQKKLSNPAIIIIGEVVKNSEKVNHLYEKLELHLAS